MADTDDGQSSSDTTPSTADVFALVGHEIRAEILHVWGTLEKDEFELSFGEIRSKMEADVEPSQLHYHLSQLVGHYIERTDKGYHIRPEGIRLLLTLRAGTLNRQQDDLSFDPDFNCYSCQSSVVSNFANGVIRIKCVECNHIYGREFSITPLEAFEDEVGSLSVSHFWKYAIQKTLSIARRVCPNCSHSLNPEIRTDGILPPNRDVAIDLSCDLCGANWRVSVGQAVLIDPGLRSFCADHGIDLLSTPYWELEFAATDEHLTVRSTDPWEVALEVTFDDDTLELVVDGDLNVLERNRQDSSAEESTSLVGGIQSDTYSMESNETEGMIILPDNEDCLEYLRRRRWPDGVTCPHCNSADTVKKGMSKKDAQRYECGDCDTIFNDLTGTIFAVHRLTLPEMFHIIQEMDETETAQIARQLDRPYNSVLDFVHKVEDSSGGKPDFAPT